MQGENMQLQFELEYKYDGLITWGMYTMDELTEKLNELALILLKNGGTVEMKLKTVRR
jgi:hypothetical protein